MKIYTRAGDDGTTGLYFGGRVAKSAEPVEVNGAVDEAQAALGWARSLSESGSRLDELLITLERDLWVLMAEVATLSSEIEMPKEFVVPGENRLSAALDVARAVIRRAERVAVGYPLENSLVTPYLNRLSDLAWTMARWAEGPNHRTARVHN